MKGQKASDLMEAIEALAAKIGSHVPFPIMGQDEDGNVEVKVFEMDRGNTYTHDALYHIKEYVDIANEFGAVSYVKIEWRDVEDTKGKPYFLFF